MPVDMSVLAVPVMRLWCGRAGEASVCQVDSQFCCLLKQSSKFTYDDNEDERDGALPAKAMRDC